MNTADQPLGVLHAEPHATPASAQGTAMKVAVGLSRALAAMTPPLGSFVPRTGVSRRMPFGDVVGDPIKIVDAAYDLTATLLEAQRHLAHAVIASAWLGRSARTTVPDGPRSSSAPTSPAPASSGPAAGHVAAVRPAQAQSTARTTVEKASPTGAKGTRAASTSTARARSATARRSAAKPPTRTPGRE